MNIFITGTDTDVGKTYVSVALLKLFNQLGYSTLGIKPVASGCCWEKGELVNNDALQLLEASSLSVVYSTINPFAFEPPIAPNIAAIQNNTTLSVAGIMRRLSKALNMPADIKIIEGVGGWEVPLNTKEGMPDLVNQLSCHIIMVVGIKLGCLNHALLTVNAIQAACKNLIGWIPNCIDTNMSEEIKRHNINVLKSRIEATYLGTIHYNEKPECILSQSLQKFLNLSEANSV